MARECKEITESGAYHHCLYSAVAIAGALPPLALNPKSVRNIHDEYADSTTYL